MAEKITPWLDQAGTFPITHIGGIPHLSKAVELGAPRTGVLHTTELDWARSLKEFKKHHAPHFMLGPDPEGKASIVQLVQIGTIGAALKAHNSKAIVQIEMVAVSREKPWLPDDETVEALASLMAECSREYGIPLARVWKDGDFGKSGSNKHRKSGNYGTVAGWYGHGDCPDPDTHWDPGNLKWSVVLDRAKEISAGFGAPSGAGPMAMASEHGDPVS